MVCPAAALSLRTPAKGPPARALPVQCRHYRGERLRSRCRADCAPDRYAPLVWIHRAGFRHPPEQLFLANRIGIQEGPTLCAHKLSSAAEPASGTSLELTNDDLRAHAS